MRGTGSLCDEHPGPRAGAGAGPQRRVGRGWLFEGSRRRRWLAPLAAFLAALWLCHRAGDAVFGVFPDVPTVSDKLAAFAERRDEFDTVFIGSSRVFNHLSPKAFDAERQAAGRASRSFNLGVSAMRPPEDFQLLERALALRPARLRLVVMELMNVYPKLEPGERDTRRVTAWHRPRETAWITAAILVSRARPGTMLRWFHDHWLAGARCFLHVGEARDWLLPAAADLPPSPRRLGSEGLGAEGDGFAPTTKAQKQESPEHQRFLARLPAYRRDVARLSAAGRPPRDHDPINPVLRWDLPRRIARLRERGIETVLFIPPVTRPERSLRALGEGAGAPTVFAFNDPEAYPELYRAEVRADAEHLDAEGAEVFTRLLARRVAAWEQEKTERQAN